MNLVEKIELENGNNNARAKPAWSHLLKWSEWQPLKLAYKQNASESQPLDETLAARQERP